MLNNNFDWTQFAIDAEFDRHGSKRICEAYNKLRAELAAKDAEIERLKEENTDAHVELSELRLVKERAITIEAEYSKLLAEREERERQEPVAWINKRATDGVEWNSKFDLCNGTPLYARPVPAIPEGMVPVPLAMFDELIQCVEGEYRGINGRDLTGGFLTDVCNYRASLPGAPQNGKED